MTSAAQQPPDPTTRFTDRVDHYVRYRPRYPPALVDFFRTTLGLTADHVIADVGSGTGILTRLFLENGNRVIGVEPNPAMRDAAEVQLSDFPRFRSVDGRAERTGLAADSVDLVVAAQSFHWFDKDAARVEFTRILRPAGWVALVWNSRRQGSNPFLEEYEQLLQRWGTDYTTVRRTYDVDDLLDRFFAPTGYVRAAFDNPQPLDFEGFRGRLLSSSYAPGPEHPWHGPMLEALQGLFERHAKDGTIVLEHDCEVFAGRLDDGAVTSGDEAGGPP